MLTIVERFARRKRASSQGPSLRRSALLLVVAATLTSVACSSDAQDDDVTPDTTTSASAAGAALPDLFDVRYCEILAVTVADTGTTGEVWGTQGLNDCPQAAFDGIDTAAVAEELAVTFAALNGPRYWVLDRIVANELAGSGERRDIGDIEMRSIATVDLGPGVPQRGPYTEVSVSRDTEFVFDAGREIHELTAPDGSVYVMQSYSIEADPSLEVGGLTGLGGRLELPDGWAFSSRVLDDSLVVEDLDGVATVVQDELGNTYQLRTRA